MSLHEGGNRQQVSLVSDGGHIQKNLKRWSSSLEERLFLVTGVNRSASELIDFDGGKTFELLRQGGVETGSQNPRYKVRQCMPVLPRYGL